MQNSNDDAHCGLVYINGAPYVVSSAQVQNGGQLQQVYVPLHQQPPPPQQPQETQPSSYVLASLPASATPAAVTMVPLTHTGRAAQQGPLAPSQVVVLRSPNASLDCGVERTWVPMLANSSRTTYGDSGHFPTYRTTVPAAAVTMDTLQGVSVVALPPSATVMTTQGIEGGMTGFGSSDTPLQLQQPASRQRASQCLQHLSLHQRGTARLFVGQIHYDACEDDLYQIFGVYGHVLDVKIMRSGEPASRETAATPSLPASSISVAPAPPDLPSSPAPTAIIGSDTCNDSMLVNPVKAESESSRICGPSPSSGLPPPAPPATSAATALTASAIASNAVQTLVPLVSINSGNSMNPPALSLPPPKSNRRCNAFVTYSSMIEADMAISALHGRYVMGRDRPLQVTYCQATENISQFGFAHAVRLHKENKNNPLPFKSGAPTHRWASRVGVHGFCFSLFLFLKIKNRALENEWIGATPKVKKMSRYQRNVCVGAPVLNFIYFFRLLSLVDGVLVTLFIFSTSLPSLTYLLYSVLRSHSLFFASQKWRCFYLRVYFVFYFPLFSIFIVSPLLLLYLLRIFFFCLPPDFTPFFPRAFFFVFFLCVFFFWQRTILPPRESTLSFFPEFSFFSQC